MVSQGNGTNAIANTLVSRILQQGLNAATGIVTARALMPSGRGQLAAMILWSLFLAGLTTFGLPTALIYFICRHPEFKEDLISSGLAMSVCAGVITMVVGTYFLPSWLHQYPSWVVINAQWFLIFTPICSITLAGRSVLEANGLFGKSNAQQLMVPALTLVGLLSALAFHHLTVSIAALAYTLPTIPVFFFMLKQLRPLLPKYLHFPRLWACRMLLSYGIRSWGIDLLGTLGSQVDQVLVIRLLTPADMGLYAVTLSLSRIMSVIQSSAVTVLFPKATGLSTEEVIGLTGRATRISAGLTLMGSLVVAFVGPWLLKIFYGRKYIHSVGAFRVLLLEVTISGCAFLLSQAFMALGRPGLGTVLQAIGLALSIPLMLWLIPMWGVLGAATALTISTVARTILVYFSFRMFLKIRPPDIIPKREDFILLKDQMSLRFKGRSSAA
ncbi:polysaccharide biosynthesis protein (plasmid) [Granulicella tundricola MP5ACTX9]|uniref:Polysaccharide biosynthesis protein n=2 Tax=Granulicella TaxID=940557 RepID=E8X7S0_GRATM|nr:polysaccharide biosynthesis protein [Granulicella tundricola MP5ACTX9]